MPRKKDPPLSSAEQKKRFEALARDAGARQTTEEFKKTVGRIGVVRAKPAKKKF